MSEQNYANVQQQAELMKYISDNMKIPVLGAGGGFAPIGVGNWYFGSVAPQGWLICDGTTYNIADYPDLATFFASNYESTNAFGGDGVTTFAVPDLRGEFLRMCGTNSHTNQGDGANVGVHQDGSLHTGVYEGSSSIVVFRPTNGQTASNFIADEALTSSTYNIDYVGMSRIDRGKTDSSWDGLATLYTSRPTNTSLNFIIKATVSGDANAHQYSTEEQVIGKWIDGSNIYEKTFTNLNVSLTNQDSWQDIVKIPNGNIAHSLKLYMNAGDENMINFGVRSYLIDVNSNHMLRVRGTLQTSRTCNMLTIQYTKTQ